MSVDDAIEVQMGHDNMLEQVIELLNLGCGCWGF